MSRFLDMLALVAPQAALRRRHAQMALTTLRSYDAAQAGRRTASFRRGAGSANAEISRALPALRERSRELVRNTFIGPRALDVMTSHVIGTDLSIRFDTGSKLADKAAQTLWNDWVKACDIEGETGFNGILSLAFRAMLEGGDAIIRMVDQQPSGRSIVPLRLHVGEGDLIDETKDAGTIQPGKNRARLGVELGEYDERIGYWLRDAAPGEPARGLTSSLNSRLVKREDVIHLFRRQRPGQVRGVPVFAPILMNARDYADLLDATVVKARMEACIGLIRKSNDTASSIGAAVVNSNDPDTLTSLRPGAVYRLPPGEDAMAFAPAGNTTFEPVSRTVLMAIAAGIGITYDQLTGDLSNANYSSLRAGKIEFRRLIADLQWNMLVPQVIDRIVERFLERAVLAGLLRRREGGYRYTIVMPAHEPIDPKKDLEADILAVRAGRMSPQDFIEAWGRDWRQVMAEYKTFLDEADKAGLIFDIDARQRTRVGQPTEPNGGDANAADPPANNGQ
jgi:lambda family phage portal protein